MRGSRGPININGMQSKLQPISKIRSLPMLLSVLMGFSIPTAGKHVVVRSKVTAKSMDLPTNLRIFIFPSSGSLEIIVKSPRECEKWILYKISHRLSGPNFFLTQNFSTKKIILKVGIFDFWRKKIIKAKKKFLW